MENKQHVINYLKETSKVTDYRYQLIFKACVHYRIDPIEILRLINNNRITCIKGANKGEHCVNATVTNKEADLIRNMFCSGHYESVRNFADEINIHKDVVLGILKCKSYRDHLTDYEIDNYQEQYYEIIQPIYSRKNWTDQTRQYIVDTFLNGASQQDIAYRLNAPLWTVQRTLKETNTRKDNKKMMWTTEEDQQIIDLTRQGKSSSEIGEIMGHPYYKVKKRRAKIMKGEKITIINKKNNFKKEYCLSGRHKMEGDNIKINSNGGRACRACFNEKRKEWRKKMRDAKS